MSDLTYPNNFIAGYDFCPGFGVSGILKKGKKGSSTCHYDELHVYIIGKTRCSKTV